MVEQALLKANLFQLKKLNKLLREALNSDKVIEKINSSVSSGKVILASTNGYRYSIALRPVFRKLVLKLVLMDFGNWVAFVVDLQNSEGYRLNV